MNTAHIPTPATEDDDDKPPILPQWAIELGDAPSPLPHGHGYRRTLLSRTIRDRTAEEVVLSEGVGSAVLEVVRLDAVTGRTRGISSYYDRDTARMTSHWRRFDEVCRAIRCDKPKGQRLRVQRAEPARTPGVPTGGKRVAP